MDTTLTADDPHPMLRPTEAAERLAVTRRTIYRLIDRGELRAVQVGSVLRISHADLDSYLARHQLGAVA
jgi:excisionase family DNA binding protein